MAPANAARAQRSWVGAAGGQDISFVGHPRVIEEDD
jgi:hypothetical protein